MSSVNVLVAEDDGSALYRLKEPARVAALFGLDVRVYHFGDDAILDADTWVLNRPIREQQADLVERLLEMGKRVVVDMDDDFHHLVPEHSMYGGPGLIGSMGLPLVHLERACAAATAVTVTTPALLEVYGYGHGHVIENHVPASYLRVRRELPEHRAYVGWTGSIASHPNDLLATQGGAGRGIRKGGAMFAHIGPSFESNRAAQLLGYTGDAITFGWKSPRRYPRAIAEFDVGLVPLEPSLFNEAKSWLKGLEYAALGVPFVASPTADYVKLNNLGAGLLAESRNEWSAWVQELLHDADFRAELADKGTEVAASLTVEGNLDKWLGVWMGEEPSAG